MHAMCRNTASGQGPVAISGENVAIYLLLFPLLSFSCCPCDGCHSTSSRRSTKEKRTHAHTHTPSFAIPHTCVRARICACSAEVLATFSDSFRSTLDACSVVSFAAHNLLSCLPYTWNSPKIFTRLFTCVALYQRVLLIHQQLTDKTEANAFISDIIHVSFSVSTQ